MNNILLLIVVVIEAFVFVLIVEVLLLLKCFIKDNKKTQINLIDLNTQQ